MSDDAPDSAPDSGPDSGPDSAAADTAATNGDAANRPGLMIGAQYIKDLSFENPQGPEILANLKTAPQIQIEVHANTRALGDGVHEVTLFIRGEAESDGKTVFIVELTYGAIVTVNAPDAETIKPILLIEAPRHLFPFARAIISNVTRDGGFPPLMIDPLDFAGMYVEQHGMPEGAG